MILLIKQRTRRRWFRERLQEARRERSAWHALVDASPLHCGWRLVNCGMWWHAVADDDRRVTPGRAFALRATAARWAETHRRDEP